MGDDTTMYKNTQQNNIFHPNAHNLASSQHVFVGPPVCTHRGFVILVHKILLVLQWCICVCSKGGVVGVVILVVADGRGGLHHRTQLL